MRLVQDFTRYVVARPGIAVGPQPQAAPGLEQGLLGRVEEPGRSDVRRTGDNLLQKMNTLHVHGRFLRSPLHDVAERRLELKISDAELARRRAEWKMPPPRFERGYGALYQQHITQADQGCDFDFLEGTAPTPEPEIH